MTATQLNLLLGAVLLALLGLVSGSRNHLARPNWQLFRAMKHSPAAKSFEPNSHFANQRTQQPRVPGTIPRGHMPLHFTPTSEDAQRAGEELVNPYRVSPRKARTASVTEPTTADSQPGSETTLETVMEGPDVVAGQVASEGTAAELEASAGRGQELYRIHCSMCHGSAGAGDGLVAQRGFPPPPPLTTGKSLQIKDGQLFHILTYGQGSMAPLAGQLSVEQRWDLVNFVRALQARQPATSTTAASGEPSPAIESSATTFDATATEVVPTVPPEGNLNGPTSDSTPSPDAPGSES